MSVTCGRIEIEDRALPQVRQSKAAADARRQRLQCSVQRRNRVEEQRRIDLGRPQHLDEMAEEAKPGDIGAGARTRFADATRRLAAGLLHHRKRPVDPGTLRLPAHLGSKQAPVPSGGEQAIAHAHRPYATRDGSTARR
jgi:hypothetical protein